MSSRQIARWTVCAAALVLVGACDDSPVVPSVTLGQDFVVAPHSPVRLDGGGLRLEFVQVTGDSRCPADALCVQGGDAIVDVRLTGRSASNAELHTGDASRSAVEFEGYTVRLVDLQPYPFSSRTTQQGEYRATLRVTQ